MSLPEANLLNDYDLVIGLDTEYVSGAHIDGIPDDQNPVISYQAAVLNPATGQRVSGLFTANGLNKNQRSYFAAFLGRAIAAALKAWGVRISDLCMPTRPLRIAVCAHYARADLCGFRDFKRLRKQFDGVRKTYASVQRPASMEIPVTAARRIKATATLFDTRLLSPAGKGSLRELGALLGFDKLTVPDVIDEHGIQRPGIERMDLVAARHQEEFNAYAIRDAEIAVAWLEQVCAFAAEWGLKKAPSTIGAIAIAKFEKIANSQASFDFANFLGRTRTNKGALGDPLPELLSIQSLAADCYHGGRNEAYEHGIIRGQFTDMDLRGAYTNAMAAFREPDWAKVAHTTDIDQLAILDIIAFACVDFEFPATTRFPALPVDGGDYGLVYPLHGTSYCTGPELVVARNMGARLTARAGVVIPWLDPHGPRPFVDFARTVNQARAKYEKGSALELLAKEAGNSAYGKLAQAVSGKRSMPKSRRTFDTRLGEMTDLTPSKITSAPLAAMTSALPRAVLSEILSRLPAHVAVASATTDGWLCDASEDEIREAASGPVASYFASLRAMVDPGGSDAILEQKHAANAILQCKTRGVFSLEPAEGSKPIVARAGHRLEQPFDDPMEEVAAFLRLFVERQYGTELARKDFVSISAQWRGITDLFPTYRKSKVNLDYDLKRRPVGVQDGEMGLIRFSTEPWSNLDEFLKHRAAFDNWREVNASCLKQSDDWRRFLTSMNLPKGAVSAGRTAFSQAVVVACAKGCRGFPSLRGRGRRAAGVSRQEISDSLTAAGIPGVTEAVLEHAARREPDPIGMVTILTAADRDLQARLLEFISGEALATLLSEGGEKHDQPPLVNSATENTGSESSINFRCLHAKPDCALNSSTQGWGVTHAEEIKIPARKADDERTPELRLDERRHLSLIADRLGLSRLRIDRAGKQIGKARLRATPLERRLLALVLATADARAVSEAEAKEMVHAAAAATLLAVDPSAVAALPVQASCPVQLGNA